MSRSRICKFIIGSVLAGLLILAVILSLSFFPSDGPPTLKPITEEVYFFYYNKGRPNESIELKTGERLSPTINPKLPWKFFIHGWTTSPTSSAWFQDGKAEYFRKGDYNIVFVDWSKPANQSYLLTVMNAMDVGKYVGKFIIHLSKNGVSLDDVHLLGHSLGSHMVGFSGKYVRDNARKVARISGLDPAATFYENKPITNKDYQHDSIELKALQTVHPDIFNDNSYLVLERFRLSKEDAEFVDIIHTDVTYHGISISIGHCDFYPNGRIPLQPGCENEDMFCSHDRAAELFVESINSNNFVAKECSSYEDFENDKCKNNSTAIMGENIDHNTRGIFYLKTKSSPPYAIDNLF